jgi:hypothetical protein
MAEYDLRLDLPALAYINAQLISLLTKGGTAFDAKRHLFTSAQYKDQGLSEYEYDLWNQSLALSLLYCCLVVPRELLDLPEHHQIWRDFDDQKIAASFDAIEPSAISSFTLVRCLRNSVSHALFKITAGPPELGYEFWTERDPIFRGTIGHRKLVELISKVGTVMGTEVLKRKHRR